MTDKPFSAAMWTNATGPRAYACGLEPNAFSSQADRLAPGVRALAPGDGEGRNPVCLADRLSLKVTPPG